MCGEEQRRRAEKEDEPSELGVLSKKSAGEVYLLGARRYGKRQALYGLQIIGFYWA
jgi:hypothetical protein